MEASSRSTQKSFTTYDAGTCSRPVRVWSLLEAPTQVTLFWNYVVPAANYGVRYRVIGTTAWTNILTIEPYIALTIQPGTTYQWQVRANCGGSSSAYSTTGTFTTPVLNAAMPMAVRQGGEEENGNEWLSDNEDAPSILLFPNPATDNLQVQLSNIEGTGNWSIHDVAGRLVKTIGRPTGDTVVIEIADLAPGVYFLGVPTQKGPESLRFVKM